MLFPLQIPVTGATIILLRGDIDPTYFWFGDDTSIPPTFQFFLRSGIIFMATFHGFLGVTDIIISLANVVQTMLSCFKVLATPTVINLDGIKSELSEVYSKFGKSAKFPKCLLKYRQLSILATVSNQAFYYIIPTGLFIGLFVGSISVYFVIKLVTRLSFVFKLISILVIIVVGIAANTVLPMGAEALGQSIQFISFWKQERYSGYRRRQLESCRPLGFWVGPFFLLGKETRVKYLELVLYYTINLLISV